MEIYHSIYDHFIGDFNCIHVLLFNILDDIQQLEQNLIYWLEFLRVRISAQEPLGSYQIIILIFFRCAHISRS
jgi:death-associated protein kinase